MTTASKPSEFQAAILNMLVNKTADETSIGGTPTDAFWEMWNNRKNSMKSAGFEVCRVDGKFRASIRFRDFDSQMTESQARICAAEKAAENEFWKSPEGRAAFGEHCR